MRFIQYIFVFLSVAVFAFGEDNTTQNKIKYAYINIDSNLPNTPILFDGKVIGNTPIKAFKVEAGKTFELVGVVDKDYYEKDILKKVNLIPNTQKDIFLKFKKSKAKLFLIGDKAHLYINNRFIKALNEENRVTTIDAGKNIEIYLEDKYRTRTLFEDIKANSFYDLQYTLVDIPKDLRLYTTTIENLMWEDTKHASSVQLDWDQAKIYCEDLNIEGLRGWRMPTLEQLQRLQEKYQEKMYHGHGKTFYWSDKLTDSKNGIWSYASAVNFKTGRVTTPVKEIETGYVRCVKELGNTTNIVVDEKEKEFFKEKEKIVKNRKKDLLENEEELEKVEKEDEPDYGYDPALTKDLDRYMLK